jgi:hypothetical protein
MNGVLGHDLSSVRIHTDAQGAESARALAATAYSVGDHVVFGAGEFDPGTAAGDRLLAHELTHVAQAGCGGRGAAVRRQFAESQVSVDSGHPLVSSPDDPAELEAASIADRLHSPGTTGITGASSAGAVAVIHRQPAGQQALGQTPSASFEKTSEQLEAIYRRLGDVRRANAIRMCRMNKAGACNAVLTQSEVQALYKLSTSSKGDKGKILAGLKDSAPTLALLMGGGELAGAGVGTGAAAGTGAVAGAGISGGAVAATGVGVIVVVCAIAGYQLWQMTKFQSAIEDAGFIILDDPLQVCIRGCHQGTSPRPVPDWRGPGLDPFPELPPLKPGDLEKWFPRAGPKPRPVPDEDLEPEPQPKPEAKPRPRPFPDPEPDEEHRHCQEFDTFQRGGNTCHDRFATAVSGVTREWMVVTPEGISDSFDALGQDRKTLWEMKTGYGWLNRTDLTPAQVAWRDATRERWATQAAHQQIVADRCNFDLKWAFTSEEARRFADGIIQPPTVRKIFSCNEDGERGVQPRRHR